MGRYLERMGASPIPSATPRTTVPETVPVQGRYVQRVRGELPPTEVKGRYRTFIEKEREFLASEEGKRLQEEIKKQLEEAQRAEEERLREVQRRAQESVTQYETATERERRMFGETGTSTLHQSLTDLGYTEEEIEKGDYKGIDLDALEKYRKEKEEFERQFGTAATTEMYPEQDPKTLKDYAKGAVNLFNKLFLEKRTITAPFQNKLDPNRENVGPQAYGAVTEFAGEIASAALDSMVRTIGLATAEAIMRTKAAFDPNKKVSDMELELPFGKGWIFEEMDITEDNKIRPYLERSLDELEELNRLSPDTPIKNNITTVLDQTIIPLLDATIVLDILNAAARPLIVTVASKEIPPKILRTVDDIEIVNGAPKKVRVPVYTDTAQLANAYQVLGFSADEIANIAKMTPYEQAEIMANRIRERAVDIFKDDFTPSTFADGKLKPQENPQEMIDALEKLRKEGAFTAEQEAELYRLNDAYYTILGINLKNGVVGIPKMMQFGLEMARVLSTPLKNFKEAEAALERALRLRARAAGEAKAKPKFGLSIEDVGKEGGGFVDEATAKKIDDFIKKTKEDDSYSGMDFEYDSRTNTILIKPEGTNWSQIPDDAQTVLTDLAKSIGVNLGESLGRVTGELPSLGDYGNYVEIVKGFSPAEIDIEAKIQQEMRNLQKRRAEVLKADEELISEGLPPDDPTVEALIASGVNQADLVKILTEMQNITTDRTLPNLISRQLLNTPLDVRLPPPIRKTALNADSPLDRGIIDSQTGIIASMADAARQLKSAADFERRFSFLADANIIPNVATRGTGIFQPVGTVRERIDDLTTGPEPALSREDIKKIIRAEIPTALIEMTAPMRAFRLAEATTDMDIGNLMDIARNTPTGDVVRSFIYERSIGLRNLTSSQVGKPDEVLEYLRNQENKPNIPLFLLTNQGKLSLLSQNRPTAEAIAMAKLGKIDTITGYILDVSGGIDEFRSYLKENNLSLRDFALYARKLEPTLTPKKVSKAPTAQMTREQVGLITGRLTRVGTSEANNIIVPTDLIRKPFPIDKPIIYNGLVAREQFVIPKLTVIGEGSSRINFEMGRNGILKVAKNIQGKVQNIMIYNSHAQSQGLTPRLFAGGDNWILTERHAALHGPALRYFEDFIDFWRGFSQFKQKTAVHNREAEILNSIIDPANIIDDLKMEIIKEDLNQELLNQTIYDFLTEWRKVEIERGYRTKEGKPFYNWTELSRYNLNLDFLKEDSWGVRPDNTLVLIDEGALYSEALGYFGKKDKLNVLERFVNNFGENINRSQKTKDAFKDWDPHTMFGFTPVPAIDGGDDEEGYNDDILRSAVFTAMASMVPGGRGWRGGKGKMPKKKPTALDKQRALELPKATPATPQVVAQQVAEGLALNSDAFAARTGEAFGGVFPQTTGVVVGSTPRGLPLVDSPTPLAPLGNAGYSFVEKDVAAQFDKDGAVVNYISNMDNPLVLNTDKEFKELAKAAGIDENNIYVPTKKEMEANITALRDYIEKKLGHDGVIVAMDPFKGPIDMLDIYFGHNQSINFNTANYKLATSPNVPNVTVVKGTRAKKLQRQIMRAIDPPESMVTIKEKTLLKKRLQLLNTAIKEGKKLGRIEARKSIAARLNNIWEFRMEKQARNTELQLLRQRILDRERELVKRELVDYAVEMLPSKVDREFLTERGKLIRSIPNMTTRNQLVKAFLRIERMRIETEKRLIVRDIKDLVSNIANSPSISADYRKMIKDVIKTIDLTRRRPDTIRRIAAMRDYVDRSLSAGMDITITADMQKEIELLAVKGIENLTVGDLKNFYNNIKVLGELGKAKRRTYLDLMRMKADKIMDEIEEGATPFNTRDLDKVEMNKVELEDLSTADKLGNWLKDRHSTFLRTKAAIKPMDYFADYLDGGRLGFDGPVYRAFRDRVNINYNKYLNERDAFQQDIKEVVERLDLKRGNFRRIGLFMQSRRPEGMARLISMGFKEADILGIKPTAKEQEFINYIDDLLNKERPIIAKIARDIFNKEFSILDDMFPMIADHRRMKMHNYRIDDMFGKDALTIDQSDDMIGGTFKQQRQPRGKRTRVKPGTIEARKPGAKGDIEIDALSVMLEHMDNTFYMKNLAETIKLLGDVTFKPNFVESVGDIGAQVLKEYVDVLARHGGAARGEPMAGLSWLNRNAGPAELAFKASAILIQWTSIFPTMAVLRSIDPLFEMANMGLLKNRQYVYKASPEVRNRIGDDFAFRNRSDYNLLDEWNKKGFTGIQKVDRYTAAASWMAAYKQKLTERGLSFSYDEVDEVSSLYADRIVRTTQSSSEWKDTSPMLMSGYGVFGNREANRVIGKFQTYVQMFYQVLSNYVFRTAVGKTNLPKKSAIYALMILLAGAAAGVSSRRSAYEAENIVAGSESEGDPRLQDTFAVDVAQEIFGTFPFMGNLMSVAVYQSEAAPVMNTVSRFGAGMWNTFIKYPYQELTTDKGATEKQWAQGMLDAFTGATSAFGVAGSGQFRAILRRVIDANSSGSGESEGGYYGGGMPPPPAGYAPPPPPPPPF